MLKVKFVDIRGVEILKRILFVCTGNTCRSPMAEGIFKKITKPNEYIIESAGLMTSNGNEASQNAIEVCKEIGVDISAHKSKPITEIDNINQVDLFVAMTDSHAQVLKKLNILALKYQNMLQLHSIKEGDY